MVGDRAAVIPRYARFQNRRVRVLYYESPDRFRIVLADDSQRTVGRSDLVFLRAPKLG